MRGYKCLAFGLGLILGLSMGCAGDGAAESAPQPESKPAATQPGQDYSRFARLSNGAKDSFIWHLYEDKKWGRPDQKPICRDILATQAAYSANTVAWTTGAIDLAEKQKWTDQAPLIRGIYQSPQNIWVYERAFTYIRGQEGKPIPAGVTAAAETLDLCGRYRNGLTDEQVKAAQDRLSRDPDKEAALVYLVKVAGWHAGKGGSDRGRKAAADVLKTMDKETVAARVRQLYGDSPEPPRSEIAWLARYLKVDLSGVTKRQFPEMDAIRKATESRGWPAASQPEANGRGQTQRSRPEGQPTDSAAPGPTTQPATQPSPPEKPKLLSTLDGHSQPVFSVAFSRDGKTVASVSWDKTIQLWDVATGENTGTFNEPPVSRVHSYSCGAFTTQA